MKLKENFSIVKYAKNLYAINACLNHSNNVKHNSINFKRYDSICKNHYNSFSFYCSDCNIIYVYIVYKNMNLIK